jgi:hypothetical protein
MRRPQDSLNVRMKFDDIDVMAGIGHLNAQEVAVLQ